MPAESFSSPNAIPPRKSSTKRGGHQYSISDTTPGVAGPSTPSRPKNDVPSSNSSNSTSPPSGPHAKSVLRPVSEGTWIAPPGRSRGASASEATIRPVATNGVPGPGRPAGGGHGLDGTNDRGRAATWGPVREKIIMGPYEYLHDRPGKNIRTQLIAAFNHWLRVPDERLAIVTKVVGMLHTASLLIDDIEDSSVLRRGVPVAHNIFGTAQTLNSANYVYFTALQELLKLGNPRFVTVYADELCNLHRGQGLDLYWRDTLTCPTEAEYLEMVGNKTAGLFRLAIKLMQAESQSDKNFVPLVNLMGIIFQIRDDYLNLNSSSYSENKGLCEDLTEGKFSFPIIHAIRAEPQNAQLMNILRQKPTDPDVKKYATEFMERVGSFAHCRREVSMLVDRALKIVTELEGGPEGENKAIRKILKSFLID